MCLAQKKVKFIEEYLTVGKSQQQLASHRNNFMKKHKNDIPNKLYYYQPFSKKHHVKSFCEYKLWCSFPSEFNDPNDSKVLLDIDELLRRIGTKDKIERMNVDGIKHKIGHIIANGRKVIQQRLKNNQEDADTYAYDKNSFTFFGYSCYVLGIQREYLRWQLLYLARLEKLMRESSDKEEIVSLYKKYFKSIIERELNSTNKSYAVCSFTTKPNEMLMWTHYADQHSGICLEYDREDVLNAFWMFFPIIYDKPISYTDLMDEDATSPLDIENLYLKRYLYKTNNWAYEDEWRAILDTKTECKSFSENTTGFLSSQIIPSRIFLGNNMTSDDKEFIKGIVTKKNKELQAHTEIIELKIEEDNWEFESYE